MGGAPAEKQKRTGMWQLFSSGPVCCPNRLECTYFTSAQAVVLSISMAGRSAHNLPNAMWLQVQCGYRKSPPHWYLANGPESWHSILTKHLGGTYIMDSALESTTYMCKLASSNLQRTCQSNRTKCWEYAE